MYSGDNDEEDDSDGEAGDDGEDGEERGDGGDTDGESGGEGEDAVVDESDSEYAVSTGIGSTPPGSPGSPGPRKVRAAPGPGAWLLNARRVSLCEVG